MTLKVRRVVTGHDDKGKAVVKIDEICTNLREGRPGAISCNVWTTSTFPTDNSSDIDGGAQPVGMTMPGGTVLRMIEFKPGVASRMHRTDSIDYVVVMRGEIDMQLDDGVEVHLNEGDVLVQRSTIHNWVNRGTESCFVAVILVHADPVKTGGLTLHAEG
jgi:quercetin dioxygenase-like cupin family protein